MAALYGRVYTVQFNGVAATAQQDLFEVVAASGKPCVILGCNVTQTTEFADAAEEMLLLLFKSGQTTSGSGGSAPTPVVQNTTDAAAGFTAEVNNTTKATAGTIVTHRAEAWNVRTPYIYAPIPEEQIVIIGGRRFTVELATTPADSVTLNGTLTVLELG
jgi:hypothetical protein